MLEDLNQQLFGFNLIDEYTLNKNGEWAFDDYDGWYCVPGTDPNYESSDTRKRLTKVKVKILHDYYFNQVGSNGEKVNTMQVFSYLMYDEESNVNFLGNTSDWSLSPPELELQYVLGSVSLGDEVITTSHPLVYEVIGDEIYINAQEVQITGPLEVQTGYTLVIQALEQIHKRDIASFSPNIRMRIKKDFYDTPVFGYAGNSIIKSFCDPDHDDFGYLANISSISLQERTEQYLAQQALLEAREALKVPLNTLTLHPNPARSDLSIQTQGAGIDRLTLFDASSRPVLQVNPGGQQLHRMDISSLSPGVYIVRAECAGEVLTEKLVVTR